MITYQELEELEPKLIELLAEAKRSAEMPGTWGAKNYLWYGQNGSRGMKHSIVGIVGMFRKKGPAILQTSEAYDVAYKELYRTLSQRH